MGSSSIGPGSKKYNQSSHRSLAPAPHMNNSESSGGRTPKNANERFKQSEFLNVDLVQLSCSEAPKLLGYSFGDSCRQDNQSDQSPNARSFAPHFSLFRVNSKDHPPIESSYKSSEQA